MLRTSCLNAAVAVLAALLASPATAQVRVIPVGDSITSGDSNAHTTWRCNLWDLLVQGGDTIDFVGSQHGAADAPAVCNLSMTFDSDHEGHSGWKISQVLAHIQNPANQVSPPPDVATIHMGFTNLYQDLIVTIFQGTGVPPTQEQTIASVNNTLFELGLLIDELRNQNPNITILVARIVPAHVLLGGFFVPFAAVDLYDDQVPALVASKDTQQSRVLLVDQQAGYDPVTDSVDGVHPNPQGEAKIAARWYPTLKFVLDSLPCSAATGVSVSSNLPAGHVIPGDSVTFSATVQGGSGPFSYRWRKDGVDIPGATGASYTINSATLPDAGVYDVVAGNLCTQFVSSGFGVFPIEFDPHVEHATGAQPVGVIAADLGASPDGRLDLVTADFASDSLSVLENAGGATFAPRVELPLAPGDQPRAVAAGDFVAGGGLDLAAACGGADCIRILGESGGTYSVAATIAAPAGMSVPSALVAGDLDGAGSTDLAVACEGGLFAGGGGLFVVVNGAATPLAAPVAGFRAVRGVALADLDGDGDLDVVAAESGSLFAAATTDDVLLYENDGQGAFTAVGALSADANPRAIVASDLDGDGRCDLAVTVESSPFPTPGGVTIFTHAATSAMTSADFGAGATFEIGSQPIALAAGDLRDDSLPPYHSRRDLVAANFAGANVGALLGYDGAQFDDAFQCAAGINPSAVLIADLDGDHTPDVVTANASSNDVTVQRAIPRALAQAFGTGCPGTNGLVPTLAPVGLPTYGNGSFSVQLEQARPFAPTLVGASLQPIAMNFGGCTLYLAAPFVLMPTYTDGLGKLSFKLPIPTDVPPFSGLNAYIQTFIYDPAGAYAGQIAFSGAVRIKFGTP